MREAVSLAVTPLLAAGIHWYLWRRLVADTTRQGSAARRVGTVVITIAALLLTLMFVRSWALPFSVAKLVVLPGYLWLAALLYLGLPLVVLEPVRLALHPRRRRSAESPPRAENEAPMPAAPGEATRVDEGRRLLIARSAAIVAGLTATSAIGYGLPAGLGPPRRRRITVPLSKLPREFDGLGIGVVADLHLGLTSGRSQAQRVVDAVNDLGADLIAVVGDLVDGRVEELGSAVEPLRGLRARLGAYFVTGNHDYYAGHEAWVQEIASLGLRVLRNERVELPGIDLAGVNDGEAGRYGDPPDYDRALAGRDRSRPVVLLAHQPDQAKAAARRGVDLQISGHTHGGQMWPLSYGVRLRHPVVAGLGEVDGMPIYVTRGVGSSGAPVRVFAPPDVTLVRLTSRSG